MWARQTSETETEVRTCLDGGRSMFEVAQYIVVVVVEVALPFVPRKLGK